ncbi:hypothetical protein [Sinomonas atrocyanea]|uniref:hypothetical protein n=1 Tax=Sinomonas atrocyanea TaxID=37927 RepID=UPI003D99EFB6
MNTVTPENPDESQKDPEHGPGGYGVPTPEQEMGQGPGEQTAGSETSGGQPSDGEQSAGEQPSGGEQPTSGAGQRADADELAGEQRDPVTGEDLKPGEAESSA